MRVLLVDDSSVKIREISKVICESGFLQNSDIDVVGDSFSAKVKLTDNYYDLLIIDINLPPDLQSEPIPNEGINFLNHLSLSEDVKVPMHIIGITQYEEILADSESAFSSELWSVVLYDPSASAWKTQLKNKIDYLNKLSSAHAVVAHADIIILTAVEIEHRSVLSLPINWKRFVVPGDPSIYHYGEIKSQDSPDKFFSVVTSTSFRMGMVASSSLATKMISHFRPRYVVMVGICAGIEGRSNYGDIIIGDPVWSYECGKYKEVGGVTKFMPEPHHMNLSVELRALVQDSISKSQHIGTISDRWKGDMPESGALSVHLGPMGSGTAVIADQSLIEPILDQNRKLLGVEMEAYGVMVSSESITVDAPKCIVIKSVCDFADSNKGDNWQEYAAFTSSYYFYDFFTDLLN